MAQELRGQHPRLLGMLLEGHMGLDLIEVEFDPKTHVIKVSGKNESGKTRFIDSVPYALGVKGFMPEEPITHGRTSGRVFLAYDAFTVERKAKKGQPTQLVVKRKGDPKPISSPQTFLDTLIPSVVMNPTDFCTKFTDKQRLEFLYEIMGNRDKIDALDRESEQIYDTRRAINRDITAIKGKLSGHSEDREEPIAEVSLMDLIAERNEAVQEDQKKQARHDWIGKARESIQKHNDLIETCEKQIQELQARIEAALKTITDLNTQIDAQEEIILNTPPSRVPGIDTRIQSIESTNATARAINGRNSIRDELAGKNAESEKITRRMKAIEQEKVDIIASANIPVDGLTIEDQQIKVNGLPWTQQSTAQGLLNAMKLVNVKQPILRHIILDWDHLDGASRDVVMKFAEENDYLIFAGMVRDAPEEGAIFMDSGKVMAPRKANPKQATLAI